MAESGLLYIPEELPPPGPYDQDKEDWLERVLKELSRPLGPNPLQGPPVTPVVFKYPNPVVHFGHCCFAGCDLLPCGCCRTVRTWCPHSVAPYGRAL